MKLRVLLCFALLGCANSEALEKQYQAAVDLYNRKDLAGAQKTLLSVYHQDSGYKNTALLLGKTYYFTGSFAAARKYFDESKSPQARLWTARAMLPDPSLRKNALEILSALAGEDPSDMEVWYWLGRAQEQTGQNDAALVSYSRAALEGSRLALVHLELSRLYTLRGDESSARRHKAIAAALAPGEPR